MNYWESKDGKDRRLIFSIGDYLQEIDATTGKSIRHVRQRRRGRPARGTRPRSRDDRPHAVEHARQGLREPDHPRLGDRRGVLLAARRSARLRRRHRQARLDVPHRAAPGRVRLRHVAEGRLEVHRRRQHLGRDHGRREARHRLLPDRLADVRFLRRRSARRQSVRQLPARARRAHRQAAVALPERCTTICGTTTTPRRRS